MNKFDSNGLWIKTLTLILLSETIDIACEEELTFSV